jgi:hypothetical protein
MGVEILNLFNDVSKKELRISVIVIVIACICLGFLVFTLSFLDTKPLNMFISINPNEVTSIVLKRKDEEVTIDKHDYEIFIYKLEELKTRQYIFGPNSNQNDYYIYINNIDDQYILCENYVQLNNTKLNIFFSDNSFTSLIDLYF